MAHKHKSWKEHRDTTSLKAGGLQAQRDSTKKRQGPASLVRIHSKSAARRNIFATLCNR